MRKRDQQRENRRISKMNLALMYLDSSDMKIMFKISDSTLSRWREAKVIPFKLIRRKYYYPFDLIQNFMKIRESK